jgi:hypothetical protein
MTDGALPASFAQERLWFVDQLDPGGANYNMPASMRLRGRLDRQALQQALDTIVARHETLRTTFDSDQGRPVQVVGPPFSVEIPVDDLSALDAADRQRAVRKAAEQDASMPVDLRTGPLLWCRLLRLQETDHVLLLTFHNITMDAWSTVNFHREFARCYEAAARGEPPDLPHLPVQYADFAVWQRENLTDEALAGQLGYWRTQLSGAPPALELPVDRVRPAQMTHAAAAHPVRLGGEPLHQVRMLARAEGATMHMTLLAALAVTLSRYSGTTDLLIGTPVSNRPDAALEPLIGCFLNTLVLRIDLAGSPTFREAVARSRDTTVGALANQDVSFAEVIAAVGGEHEANRFPLASVSFQVLDGRRWQALDHPKLPGLVTTTENVFCKTRFDLEFQLFDRPDGTVDGELIASTELFDDETVQRVITDFGDVVEAVASAPDTPVTEVVRWLPGDRRTFAGVPQATAPAARFPTLRSAVEHWARERPDAVAVVQPDAFADASLSYRGLADEAARLSAVLARLPAGTGDVVTVDCPTAPGVVAAALAIVGHRDVVRWAPPPAPPSDHLLRPGHPVEELVTIDGASRTGEGVAYVVPAGDGAAQLSEEAPAAVVGAGVGELPAEPGRVWALLDPIHTEVGLLAVHAALGSGERLVVVPAAPQRSLQMMNDLLGGDQAICLVARASTLSRFGTAIGGLRRLPVTTVVMWDDDPAAADELAGGDPDSGQAPYLVAVGPTSELPWALHRRPRADGGPPAYRAAPGVVPLVLTDSLDRCPVLAAGTLHLSVDNVPAGRPLPSDPFLPSGARVLDTGRTGRMLPDRRVRLLVEATAGGADRPAAAPASPAGTDAPPPALQRLVADVWGQVLGIQDVDPDASFFALGGHSLLAAQVVAHLRVALNWDVPLSAVFDEPTIRGLAGLLAALDPSSQVGQAGGGFGAV